jgi:hypothetical protein
MGLARAESIPVLVEGIGGTVDGTHQAWFVPFEVFVIYTINVGRIVTLAFVQAAPSASSRTQQPRWSSRLLPSKGGCFDA